MLSKLDAAQRALAEYMSEISQRAYHAGWMLGLEHALWKAVIDGPREYGQIELGSPEIAHLRELSEACGGWIYFDEITEETWIPIDDWARRYETGDGAV